MHNIEIKAHYEDLNKARMIARKLMTKYVGEDRQVDTYFKVKSGRLKIRESSIGGNQLIPYLRPTESGPKKSEYLLLPVADVRLCNHLFENLLGVEVVVEKAREIFLIDNIRVHLDTVKTLGVFFELEAVYDDIKDEALEMTKVKKLLEIFEIKDTDLIMGSYRELLIKKLSGSVP